MALILEASRCTENAVHIGGSQGTAKDFDMHACCLSRVETAPELACVHLCLQHDLDRLLYRVLHLSWGRNVIGILWPWCLMVRAREFPSAAP